MSDNTEINIVYYTYINPNSDYKTIIKGQLIDIINSKIIAKLFIVISCEFENLIDDIKILIHETLLNAKINYVLDIKNENIFEYYGIKKIYDLAINEPNKYYLYLHGKGMLNKWNDENPRTENNVALTQGSVNPWEKVLNIFKTDDAINIIAMVPGINMAWFNFWWASGKYLITCEDPKISRENRYYYESWLTTGNVENSKIYNLLDDNYETHATPSGACKRYYDYIFQKFRQ